jgi:hypothetical protein
MAWGNGGLFVLNIGGALSGGTAINLTLTTHRIALFNNSVTPNYSASIATTAYNTGTWLTANEVTGTNWAAAGPLFSAAGTGGSSLAPTVTDSPAGTMMYDMNDVVVANATFTNAFGCLLYADASTPKIGFLAVPFGSGYSPNAGTFTIQWPAAGVAAIDLTP